MDKTLPVLSIADQSEREMRIDIWKGDFADFEGTRAQLEAEQGLIPPETQWPLADAYLYWERGDLRFCLQRCRPAGSKAPRKVWIEGDWWSVRVDLASVPPADERMLKRRAADLAEAVYRASSQGRAQWSEQQRRHFAAERDERFQTFKALIPRLTPAKRGRRPRNGPTSESATATS